MKILYYHSSVFLDHHMGVLLDEAICMQKQGHDIYFVHCNNTINTCFSNPKGEKKICILCKSCTKHALKLLPKRCHIIHLDQFKVLHQPLRFQYESMKDIKNITYKGVNIGLGAVSSYVTQTRNNEPIIDHKFRNYFDYILNDLCTLTDSLENCINTLEPDLVCIFNGRLGDDRPMYDLCINKHIQIKCYEVIGGIKEEFYKMSYDNCMPHNIKANFKITEDLWSDPTVPLEKKKELGNKFFYNRRQGVPTNDKVYINNQKKGLLPEKWDPNKINITIFNTSEDEYTSIGDEFDSLQVFPSQLDGIKRILELTENDKNIHFYLRIHPNLANLPYAYHTDLYKLPDTYSNITIIPATAPISTYDLMDHSDKIIVFGSTMGLESTYWGKPVILLAASFYYSDEICYIPKNLQDLKVLLTTPYLSPKSKQEAIKWGYYFMYRNSKYKCKYIDFNRSQIHFLGKTIATPHFLKLLGSYKLYAFYSILRRKIFNTNEKLFNEIPTKGI